jgi:hypothetical protein
MEAKAMVVCFHPNSKAFLPEFEAQAAQEQASDRDSTVPRQHRSALRRIQSQQWRDTAMLIEQ